MQHPMRNDSSLGSAIGLRLIRSESSGHRHRTETDSGPRRFRTDLCRTRATTLSSARGTQMTSGRMSQQESEPKRVGHVRWWLWLVLIACAVILAYSVTPARFRHHLNAGQQLLAEGKASDARTHFQAALELNSENPETHFWMAAAPESLETLRPFESTWTKHFDADIPTRSGSKREWWYCLAQTGQLRETEKHLATLINPR